MVTSYQVCRNKLTTNFVQWDLFSLKAEYSQMTARGRSFQGKVSFLSSVEERNHVVNSLANHFFHSKPLLFQKCLQHFPLNAYPILKAQGFLSLIQLCHLTNRDLTRNKYSTLLSHQIQQFFPKGLETQDTFSAQPWEQYWSFLQKHHTIYDQGQLLDALNLRNLHYMPIRVADSSSKYNKEFDHPLKIIHYLQSLIDHYGYVLVMYNNRSKVLFGYNKKYMIGFGNLSFELKQIIAHKTQGEALHYDWNQLVSPRFIDDNVLDVSIGGISIIQTNYLAMNVEEVCFFDLGGQGL